MKITELLTIKTPLPVSELVEKQVEELQKALCILGYPVGTVDGLIGPKTRNAWAEFKTDELPGNPSLIGKESIERLQVRLDGIAANDTYDFTCREGVIDAIKHECVEQGLVLDTQKAYVLATTQWETNQTFMPVREAYWLSENWRKKNLRYFPFYGRGFVQLTWKNNYEKYSQLLDIDMTNQPDIAMQPNIALFVLIHGFKTGTFTGRRISDYINDNNTDFIGARRCINGSDRAHEISEIAKGFLRKF
ncbi:carboxypeptidase [Vibrio natriegens]|jgi:peptidoglycan hydrolase-like protein with peptidoglycan-binding domain|uniref:peptidoglycan-binding protein n=1 Tax=Vibrio natriegens TaxID=691 RepID=UPI000803EEB3|nr:peptidoglycan-binding protein [Vibrio natriegens]ANQ24299.1 carboxypeptidase [Vibrio natriegens]